MNTGITNFQKLNTLIMPNKKIKNATKNEYNGVVFRSKLECDCYKLLSQLNLPFEYEQTTFELQPKLPEIKTLVYVPDKKNKVRGATQLVGSSLTLRPITYTPDFIVYKGDAVFIIEAKGFQNDIYPVKKKLFLALLESYNDDKKYIFLEPHNLFQVKQVVQIINTYGEN